ncbi:hypothetical protein BRADI_3g07165v3 [Brachypodium distachyon]|uniref:Uncharacterized protein n=1 Tax=Brachypodium distachyon TaxID=15368 RepID=A0A0Q3F388_BRADI|nr:hypothetical protein BRADI_3g07165v3 [Brachypodium distachyon]
MRCSIFIRIIDRLIFFYQNILDSGNYTHESFNQTIQHTRALTTPTSQFGNEDIETCDGSLIKNQFVLVFLASHIIIVPYVFLMESKHHDFWRNFFTNNKSVVIH